MTLLGYLIAAVFLPLFPFSLVFNQLFARAADPRLRLGLLLLWPQFGVLILILLGERPPSWALWWALCTAVLYALRAVALRDLRLWIAFMATSSWALLWVAAGVASPAPGGGVLAAQALGLSLPLALLAWLADRLETQFGAAYAGLAGGLASSMPRLAGLLSLAVLAAIGTPLVPGFFTLLSTTAAALPVIPLGAVGILIVWLLWAWGGARILRGFVVGPTREDVEDLSPTVTRWLGLAFAVLVFAGIGISGGLL